MLEKVKVKNTTPNYKLYNYTVIRDNREGFYWYYGAGNDLLMCSRMATELRNGLVVESERVEPIPM